MSNLGSDRYKWLKAVHQSGKLTACAKNLATVLVVEFLNTNTGQLNPSLSTLEEIRVFSLHRIDLTGFFRE